MLDLSDVGCAPLIPAYDPRRSESTWSFPTAKQIQRPYDGTGLTSVHLTSEIVTKRTWLIGLAMPAVESRVDVPVQRGRFRLRPSADFGSEIAVVHPPAAKDMVRC